ncbi:Co2+/Mg2+ efflux protein ApaG [Thalassotalea sp. 1_MG-2023]|uniref:Co2+/Mg2+ efflux protein ApaG n=1 Tax=Thalassotalea sp. 1_MG-2023 TaxID=3062680 RepID=UPI0026E15F3D|nr:Co2+/Mg2+ efflux protein ApaG [Thalassotalea sp. 1_MG-2023]MDO6427087.1 Co2+/Mg2+ efflux protein ApaG [Thalassotalea sp. 1_MG-2023]
MTNKSEQVIVTVDTHYLEEQSSERDQRYVFSYTITIENQSEFPVKLLSRYWLITDANDEKSTVVGEGVIGEQPIINSGSSFTYTSGCALKTPVGTMQGHYQMIDNNNAPLKVDIPIFRLATPNILH